MSLGLVVALGLLAGGCADTFTHAQASRREGVRLYEQQAFAEAAGAFRNAVKQNPADYRSHYYLGECYDATNQNHEAIKSYRTALSVMSTCLEGRDDLDDMRPQIMEALAASIARSDGRDVEIDAMEARAKAHRSAEDYFILAKVYRLRGDADSAIRCYNSAVLFDSGNFYYHKEFGLYLLGAASQNQQAEIQLRRAFEMHGDDREVVAGLRKLGVLPPNKE
jgi:Tfp pilus assembly protein PilF